MLSIILSVILSILSLGPTEATIQAPTEAPITAIQAPTEAPIVAPVQPLTYASPTVTTEAPVKAPAPAPAPVVQAPIPAPVQAPVEAPICHEDMPCWDCATMGNQICGNPDCARLGMLTAEDYSCVPHSFYSTTEATAATEAWAAWDAAGAFPNTSSESVVWHVGTTNDAMQPLGENEVIIPSHVQPQTFHIFSIDATAT